jgi:hypothetical protein
MDEGQPINLRLQVAIMGNICIGARRRFTGAGSGDDEGRAGSPRPRTAVPSAVAKLVGRPPLGCGAGLLGAALGFEDGAAD